MQTDRRYAGIVRDALRASLGDSHRSVKTLMQWTGASERSTKHWLTGDAGPSGDYLLALLRESDAVLQAVLDAAGRRDVLRAARVLEAQATLLAVGGITQAWPGGMFRGAIDKPADPASDGTVRRSSDPENDPGRDPDSVPDGEVETGLLNERQRWFLQELARGARITAPELRRRFGVAEKTAKRDLGTLKLRGLIEFIGPPRGGVYRLRRR